LHTTIGKTGTAAARGRKTKKDGGGRYEVKPKKKGWWYLKHGERRGRSKKCGKSVKGQLVRAWSMGKVNGRGGGRFNEKEKKKRATQFNKGGNPGV